MRRRDGQLAAAHGPIVALSTRARLNTPCLDPAAALPTSLATFYDDVHVNDQGSTRVAHALAADLRSRLP